MSLNMELASSFALLLIISNCIVLTDGKHHHPVPTFFGQVDQNGNEIDRLSKEYQEIDEVPRIDRISREDAMNVNLTVWPPVVKNGEQVTLMWSGVPGPNPKDLVVYYCPHYDPDPNHYLDYFYGKNLPGWKNGHGQKKLTVYNMRESCIFKLYRSINKHLVLSATSNLVNFAGGSQAPLQGHIAMTNDPTQMRIMWVSGQLCKPPFVRYGETLNFGKEEYAYITHTYTKESMCQAPANTKGYWAPGQTIDVLLTNLKPNTRYYYTYGTEDHRSATATFKTPLPKGDRTPYKFVIYGDMGVDTFPAAYATAKNVADEIEQNNVRFVFHHGDISYARGWAYIWEQWGSLIEPPATRVPYMVGIGNHEYDHTAGGIGRDPSGVKNDGSWEPKWFNGRQDSGGECGVPMYHRYHMPDNGNSLFWYSYDFGMVHMIMMSTEHDSSPGSLQYKWLENDLKSVNRSVTPWVMVGGHRAMYCSQKIHGDYVVAENMQRLFEDLLYKYKVDIAFWAHYHSYERTCKLYKKKCVDDGIVHIVVGTAGKHLDTETWYPKPWSIHRDYAFAYGRVTVANSTSLLYEWVANDKKTVKDSVWLHKDVPEKSIVVEF